MKRGVSFEILNEYGNFLEDMLAPVDVTITIGISEEKNRVMSS